MTQSSQRKRIAAMPATPPLPLVTAVLLILFVLTSADAQAAWREQQRELMGTLVSVEFWSTDEAASSRLLETVFAEFERLDQMMNPWNPTSELSRINREAALQPVVTTPEIIAVVQRALHYSELSGGAFDISFASVGQHYDFRRQQAASEAQLAQDLQNIDFRAIELRPDSREIHFSRSGLQIDLGGIAKGYAVDRAIDILQRAGIESAAVSAGGDSRLLGDRGDRQRTIGIRHPRKEGEYAVLIPLADTAISTSGDYERYFMRDGIRFHHILNPVTGRSANKVQSVSILAAHAIDSDALSTATFVLGVTEGLNLINQLADVDAIIIDGAGKLHYSEGLLLRAPAAKQ